MERPRLALGRASRPGLAPWLWLVVVYLLVVLLVFALSGHIGTTVPGKSGWSD
jgi:hypothetical protein